MAPVTRRSFLKQAITGVSGIVLAANSCSPYPKNIKWNDIREKDFLRTFDNWFNESKLYNEINPKLKLKHQGYGPTFRANVFSPHHATPGIDYTSTSMYAAADGVVDSIIRLNTPRIGGLMVDLTHPTASFEGRVITTRYAHLTNICVERTQYLKRGDKLADVEYVNCAKLMVKLGVNLVDPDNYGRGHSYMEYYDGINSEIVQDPIKKHLNQYYLWNEFLSNLIPSIGITSSFLEKKQHRPIEIGGICMWDNIEIFRYLEELYKVKTEYYPNLTASKFNRIKEEFYANQPIILTLPLKA